MIPSVTSGYRFRITFISWWVVWIHVQVMVINSYGPGFTESITDSIICNLLLAASCLLITNNMKD